jgi:hypothetical protein
MEGENIAQDTRKRRRVYQEKGKKSYWDMLETMSTNSTYIVFGNDSLGLILSLQNLDFFFYNQRFSQAVLLRALCVLKREKFI